MTEEAMYRHWALMDEMAEESRLRHWDDEPEAPPETPTCRTCLWGRIGTPERLPQLGADVCFCACPGYEDFYPGSPDDDMTADGCWEWA